MAYDQLLAGRTRLMRENAIREILKVVSAPGMISLAGGIPSPNSFPMDIIRELVGRVLEKYGSGALQYDLTEGFPPLREQLSVLLKQRGIPVSPEEVNVASGSQGILDAVAKLLISKGDAVALEAPTYLGALSAFNPYEPIYLRMDTDELGLIPESLDRTLAENRVKFIYLVPTFQNPTGRTLPMERRSAVAEIIRHRNALLVEDDPYSALRYQGDPLPPIKTLAPDNVIYVSTLSKVFAPGLRIGFYAAPKMLRQWLVRVKQGVDLHTSTLDQALAAEYLAGNFLHSHLPRILSLYKPRQRAMLDALDTHLPEGFTVSPSDGGMFLWVAGPKGTDALDLYRRSVESGVAFVPGRFFYTDPEEGHETLRLNFTMADETTLEKAVNILGKAARSLVNQGL